MKNLLDVKEILDKNDITFWLDAGTLLFIWRDAELDPSDTDLGFYGEDIERFEEVIPKLADKGFVVKKITHPCGKTIEYSLMRDNSKIDIWPKYKRGGERWWACYKEEDGLLGHLPYHQPSYHFDKLDSVFTNNKELKIPSDTEKFLEEAYGPTWKIPNRKWQWWSDPLCLDKKWKIK